MHATLCSFFRSLFRFSGLHPALHSGFPVRTHSRRGKRKPVLRRVPITAPFAAPFFLWAILTISILCPAPCPAQSAPSADAQPLTQDVTSPATGELVLQKCGTCHSTGPICVALGKKDLASWQHVVVRMHDKGAKITAEQVAVVAQYLANSRRGTTLVCTPEALSKTGPMGTPTGKLILLAHPVVMAMAILLAFATLRMGFDRFRFTMLRQKVPFAWKRHRTFGYVVLIVWLAGMAAGSYLTQMHWGERGATGPHHALALYMFPLILFGLVTGYVMDTRKKPRVWLPLLHGLGNTILVLMALWQAKTGIDVVFGMIF